MAAMTSGENALFLYNIPFERIHKFSVFPVFGDMAAEIWALARQMLSEYPKSFIG